MLIALAMMVLGFVAAFYGLRACWRLYKMERDIENSLPPELAQSITQRKVLPK